jgi:hypothetical protein
MSFLDTELAAINRLEPGGPWGRFCVTDPRQRMATLRDLWRGDAPLSLGQPGGLQVPATLWAVDDVLGRLHFSVNDSSAKADTVMALPDLWAAAYLDDTKVQFSLQRRLPDGSAKQPGPAGLRPQHTLFADALGLMLLMPRRRAVRVRRPVHQAPWLHFGHPLLPETKLTLRAMDISTSGCGLWRPADQLPLQPGLEVRAVEVELDDESIFFTDMRVQHATPSGGARAGTRVGCSWLRLSNPAQDTLQRWICSGRRRRERVPFAL